MTPIVICPAPVLQFLDENGAPLAGGQLFTYAGGTTNKTPTYTDSTGATPNTNPIVLNDLGQAPSAIFVPPSVNIKFTLAPAGSSDPPTNPIWTIDDIAASPTVAGTISLQDANNVSITGGEISGLTTLICTGATGLQTLVCSGIVTLKGATLAVEGNLTVGGISTFSDPVTINADVAINASYLTVGSTTGNVQLAIQTLSTGFGASIIFQTGASTRWALYKDNTAESGSNSGSNFELDAYADTGLYNFTALSVNRETGLVAIESLEILANGGLTLANQVSGAASATATLTNAPHAANPSFWIPATVNGTPGFIPFWTA